MVQYALLMLLPLAVVASCPCPPAPDSSAKVCGSNHHTYDSACHLECAKIPGLTVFHPGPCSALDIARRLLTAKGTHPRRRPARSASEDYEKYMECSRNCPWSGCGCRHDDWDCNMMCRNNCRCPSCLGIPGGDLDSSDKWNSCLSERDCEGTKWECKSSCSTPDCKDACQLDHMKCWCGCMEVAGGNATAGSTSTTTEHPVTTTGTEEPVTSEATVTVTEAPVTITEVTVTEAPVTKVTVTEATVTEATVTSTTEEPSAPPRRGLRSA